MIKDYADEPEETRDGNFMIGLCYGVIGSSIFWILLFCTVF